jgi:hypothetical protein
VEIKSKPQGIKRKTQRTQREVMEGNTDEKKRRLKHMLRIQPGPRLRKAQGRAWVSGEIVVKKRKTQWSLTTQRCIKPKKK